MVCFFGVRLRLLNAFEQKGKCRKRQLRTESALLRWYAFSPAIMLPCILSNANYLFPQVVPSTNTEHIVYFKQ